MINSCSMNRPHGFAHVVERVQARQNVRMVEIEGKMMPQQCLGKMRDGSTATFGVCHMFRTYDRYNI